MSNPETQPMAAADVNVSDLVSNARLNAFHLRVIALCASLLFLEGFDLYAMSYAAPAMGIPKSLLGPVFSAGQLGLMVGALLFGIAGDRWGRKRVFIVCGLIFGLGTLATVVTPSFAWVLFWRVIAGLGLGGASPIAITIASDYCPKRLRAGLTMIMYCGFTVGSVFAGVVNAYLPRFGWRSVFYVGGTAPLLFTPLLLLALPESLNYLISRGTRGAEISRILAKLTPGTRYSPDSRFCMAQAYQRKGQIPELFRSGYARRTVLLWSSLFISLITLFSLSNWLPTLLTSMSITPKQIVAITASAQFTGLLGSLAAARLIVLYPPFRVATVGFTIAALLLLVLGKYGATYIAFLWIFAAIFFFIIGNQNIVNAMSGEIYPPRIRATGSGWAIGIGRIGGVVGPMIAGALLMLHWTPGQLFMAAALPMLGTAAGMFLLSIVVKGAVGAAQPDKEWAAEVVAD